MGCAGARRRGGGSLFAMSILQSHIPQLRSSSFVAALALVLAAPVAFAGDDNGMGNGQGGNDHRGKVRTILAFDTMYGVDGPFVGDANPVDGIPGDELPWVIKRASGFLLTNGKLKILVRGLVFKDDPSVPENLRGINDETEFRAAVACLTEDGDQVVQANVITDGSPTNEKGNALIKAKLDLPNPCVGPRVFILAGSEDKWFAVTGFESEEEGD